MNIMREKKGYISRKKLEIEILELKSTVSKMKKFTKSLNRASDIAEERVSKLEDRSIEIIQTEVQREKD